jgi:metallophosphoesterase superfamily enzyme
MRTLVISDLHLGMRLERDVLRRRAPLGVLLEALADVQRLVLLGDVVELSERNSGKALVVAEPVLRARPPAGTRPRSDPGSRQP